MIKKSYLFFVVGFGIMAFFRTMNRIEKFFDISILFLGIIVVLFGFYFRNKEKNEDPKAHDFK